MTIEAGPPPQLPQLSPDHQWIWDGSRWLPVARHEAVFPTWQSVGAGLPAEQPASVRSVPTPPPVAQRASPVMPAAYVAPAPAPGMEVPLWKQQASTGVNKFMYFVAGFIGLVIVGIVLSSLGTITLPWQSSPEVRPTPPTISGTTDAARADNFTNTLLAPRMSALEDDVTLANQTCAAGLTTGCQESLIEVDNKISATIEMTNHLVVPFCIYPQYAALRADLTKLDKADGAAYQGFRDNRPAEFQSGLSQFRAANAQVVADNSALTAATKACGTATGS